MTPQLSGRGGSGGDDLTGRQPSAVRSALSVLEEVARVGPGVTAQQISANLGLPRATAYRLLNLLVQDEYLVRLPDLTGFALGRKVSLLAGLSAQQENDREVTSLVSDLRGRIRGAVHLADLRSGRIELIDEDPDFPIAGSDLQASALGLLVRAEQGLRRGATPLPYAVASIGTMPGFGSFAAAVRGPDTRLIAGLLLVLPLARIDEPGVLASLVASDVDRLAAILGH